MLFFIIWFIGFCLIIGYCIVDGCFKKRGDDGIGAVMLALLWPILMPFVIGIAISCKLMKFLINKFRN